MTEIPPRVTKQEGRGPKCKLGLSRQHDICSVGRPRQDGPGIEVKNTRDPLWSHICAHGLCPKVKVVDSFIIIVKGGNTSAPWVLNTDQRLVCYCFSVCVEKTILIRSGEKGAWGEMADIGMCTAQKQNTE